MARKVIQISESVENDTWGMSALCDDGSIYVGSWKQETNVEGRFLCNRFQWDKLPDVPQDNVE